MATNPAPGEGLRADRIPHAVVLDPSTLAGTAVLTSSRPAAEASGCVGDCDGSGDVMVNEIVTIVNIALGTGGACLDGVPAGATVDIALIIQAVNNALNECRTVPATPTPAARTPTPTSTPTTGSFLALAPAMGARRAGHTATLLPDGHVLLTGGDVRAPGSGPTNPTAEEYDPTTNRFAVLAATMSTAREGHTATLLPNGKVLFTGGFNEGSSDLDTAELYDPATNRFTALAATMTAPRTNHTATLLRNGKVLITGGAYHSGSAVNTAELFDPVANTFSPLAATMRSRRQGHTATLLPTGHVLLTGGVDGCCDPNDLGTNLDTAEVYDPVAQTFTALTATMTSARFFHAASLLDDGRVLLTGGLAGESIASVYTLDSAEVFDPVAETFVAVTAAMTSRRAAHTATLLPGGTVLVTGGFNDLTGPALDTAELYGS